MSSSSGLRLNKDLSVDSLSSSLVSAGQLNLVGALPLAAAAGTGIASLTSAISYISASANVTTINPPSVGFRGIVYLVNNSAGVVTLATGGNIALGSTIAINTVAALVYDGLLFRRVMVS